MARQCGVEWKIKRKISFSRQDANGNTIPPSTYQPIESISISGTDTAVTDVLERAKHVLMPAPDETIRVWLAELSVLVARRLDDDMTETLRLQAYTDRLRLYPADVVHHVLLKKTYKFWPTWDELEARLNSLIEERRAIIAALERQKNAGHADQSQNHERPTLTPEQRARMAQAGEDVLRHFQSRMNGGKT